MYFVSSSSERTFDTEDIARSPEFKPQLGDTEYIATKAIEEIRWPFFIT